MLIFALLLFVVAALLGVTVAVALVKKQPTSKPIAVTHGLFGAAGLAVLVYYVSQHPHPLLTWAIGSLVVAALGGALLFMNDLRQKPGPVGLIAIHALVALIGVGFVLLVTVG